MIAAEIFHALGDPTRLQIVERLSDGAPQTLSSVSSGLNISRQGARKHLKVLEGADLISLVPNGRDTNVYLDSDTLKKGKKYIAELEKRWDMRLEALRQFVEDDQPGN